MKRFLLIIVLTAGLLSSGYSNNIAVSNISLSDQVPLSHYCNVKFDISWDNSWRTSSAPVNWDAAWVFVKYRVNGGPWNHATLSSVPGDHTPATGSSISPSSDGLGVFIYRSASGSGSNAWTNVKIRWNYGTDGVADDASLEVKLFALEMVYVPQGSFYIGDGNGTLESSYAFHTGTTNSAVHITTVLAGDIRTDVGAGDDNQINSLGVGVDGDGGIDVDDNGVIDNASYPTGYPAFYMMKYEASQEEYVDFINTLTRTQQQSRVEIDISGSAPNYPFAMSATVGIQYRSGIRCPASIAGGLPITFFCDLNNNTTPNESNDGQNVACNFMSWMDMAAYADWAGLRPATELEIEKASRGTNDPVYSEFPWGTTTSCSNVYSLSNSGANNEVITNFCTGTGNAVYTTTYGTGPVRTGIMSASVTNKNRIETGASYYGIMELTGNVSERSVSLGTIAGRSYTGLNGNGKLNNAGDADVDYWPGINGNASNVIANTVYGGTTGVTNSAGAGRRLSSYNQSITNFGRVSDRYYTNSAFAYREHTGGIRLVRNAP